MEDVVLRGLEGDGINPAEIVATLRTMYVRTPAIVESAQTDNGFTPG